MSRSYWEVLVRESGDIYVSSFSLPRPNSNLDVSELSTATKIVLADGSEAFNTPEVALRKDDLSFTWENINEDDETFIQSIKDSIAAKEIVKIVTHNASYIFIGKFTTLKQSWEIAQTGDIFTVTATFSQSNT